MTGKYKLLIAFLMTSLIYVSCRKADLTEASQQTKYVEEKFFTSHRSSNPAEKAIVEFMKRKNDKEHFVEQTVKQIGYPWWDKVISKSKHSVNARGNSDSSLNTYYIPFVRDSQNYVNASLIINTSSTDTTFSFKRDWQYKQRQNNTNSYTDSAEYYAIFFMVLDKSVFGHTQFNIVDTNLFKHNNRKALRIRLDSLRHGELKLLSVVEVCQDVTISWQNCPWNNTTCSGPDGTCDNCWQCTSSVTTQYCWQEWVEGGGTGGGGGFNPSPGGFGVWNPDWGGGGGTGWNPDIYLDEKGIFDTYTGDEDNNIVGGIDTTGYQPYQIGQPWGTVVNVIPKSDFVGWGTPGILEECMEYAKAQIAKKGYKISDYFTAGQTIQLYTSANGANTNAVKDGIGYLISALNRGIPVIVGVDDKYGSPNSQTDNTTDHFIVIVGMGSDAIGKYFTFYDNASNTMNHAHGTNSKNKLYFYPSTWKITGVSSSSYFNQFTEYDYILTMIRKSK